ncbi:MAG: fibrobacter succinogenes major paralogous domain-containing protein [Bacteroidota bacterium]
MKNENKTWIYSLIIIGFVVLLADGCSKDDSNSTPSQLPINGIYFNPNLTYGTMIDIDSNHYKTITIGTQTWMAENLKVSRYRNGEVIQKTANQSTWRILTAGAYCNYNNDNFNTVSYGNLYNYYAIADPRKICPLGWHLPSDNEWSTLTNYLGSFAGQKLKESGSAHWNTEYYVNGTNESGFTALPGGYRNSNGDYLKISLYGNWWSSSSPTYLTLDAFSNFAHFFTAYENDGISVRCLKDSI